MGFDPLSIKFIRMAHEMGLGCGDPREIEIVGDASAANENWHFAGPFKKMTFASRMQHQIYWGPMKKPIEWSLKTVLAPWAYIASVVYHDSFWYPMNAQGVDAGGPRRAVGPAVPQLGVACRPMPTATPTLGARRQRSTRPAPGPSAIGRASSGTCIREAPEFSGRKRHAGGTKP